MLELWTACHENEADSLRRLKQLEFKKYENMSQGQRSKCQRLRITSSIIVADIPIKPQQFPTGSLWVFHLCDLDLRPMTLKLNRDLDIPKLYLQTENEVARSSHSKYIA